MYATVELSPDDLKSKCTGDQVGKALTHFLSFASRCGRIRIIGVLQNVMGLV